MDIFSGSFYLAPSVAPGHASIFFSFMTDLVWRFCFGLIFLKVNHPKQQ